MRHDLAKGRTTRPTPPFFVQRGYAYADTWHADPLVIFGTAPAQRHPLAILIVLLLGLQRPQKTNTTQKACVFRICNKVMLLKSAEARATGIRTGMSTDSASNTSPCSCAGTTDSAPPERVLQYGVALR